MNLNHVETDLHGTFRSINKCLLDPLDTLLREFMRAREALGVLNCARRDDIVRPAVQIFGGSRAEIEPRRDGGRFTTCMSNLDADLLVLRVRESHDIGKRGSLLVIPETEIFRSDSTFWRNSSRLRERETRSARNYAANYVQSVSEIAR